MPGADISTVKQTSAQHNAAFTEWQAEHRDDPEAVTALLEEHARIVTEAPQATKSTEIPKRVAVISQQMADMVCLYTPTYNPALTTPAV